MRTIQHFVFTDRRCLGELFQLDLLCAFDSYVVINEDILGTPDTNFKGRRTLMALKVLRSTGMAFPPSTFSGVTKVINLRNVLLLLRCAK